MKESSNTYHPLLYVQIKYTYRGSRLRPGGPVYFVKRLDQPHVAKKSNLSIKGPGALTYRSRKGDL